MKRFRGLTALVLCAASMVSMAQKDTRKELKFEAEEWCVNKDEIVQDRWLKDKWGLWTTEPDIAKKRSGAKTLRTPVLPIDKDRERPEDGAQPLHMKFTGIPKGFYKIVVSHSNRPIAYSFDNKSWGKWPKDDHEQILGFFDITDGSFELWADDLYATTKASPGPAYLDCIRMIPYTMPKLYDLTAFTRRDGTTQLTWISSFMVPKCQVNYGLDGKLDQHAETDEDGMRNHEIVLKDLKPGGTYTAQVQVTLPGAKTYYSEKITFVAGARPIPPKTIAQSIPLSIIEPTGKARTQWPVSSGVPFAKGKLAKAENAWITGPDGKEIGADFSVLSTWPDGSVKWLLCEFLADTDAAKEVVYTLNTEDKIHKAAPGFSFRNIPEPGSVISVSDGEAVSSKNTNGLKEEVRGAVRFNSKSSGDYVKADGSDSGFRWSCEMDAFAGKRGLVRYRWYVGNANSDVDNKLVQSVSWTTGEKAPAPAFSNGAAFANGVAVQDWDSHYSVTANGKTSEGQRMDGLLRLSDKRAIWVRDFWQSWPKGITAQNGGYSVELLPKLADKDYPAKYNLNVDNLFQHFYWFRDGKYMFTRGMEFETDIWSYDRQDGESDADMAAWLDKQIFAVASPEYYCSANVFPPMNPSRADVFPEYEQALDKSLAYLERGRIKRGEYGWMNYGDWYGERRWNWGNNEYDMTYVCAMNFARTGRTDFLWWGEEMARHYSTIDYIAFPWRKKQSELMYEHCVGHLGTFIKKGDPRIASISPMSGLLFPAIDGSGGHDCQAGNFYYWCLTGNRRFLEVGEAACRSQAKRFTPNFIIRIERAAGWPLVNAVNAYQFTNDPYYLNCAKILFEVIKKTQNPETGCFDLPQDLSECECPDKREHRGGKAFAVGVLLHGLARYYEVTGDPEVKNTIVRCADWLLDYSWDNENKGFRYKTGCPVYSKGRGISVIIGEGIVYASEISGNPRYFQFVRDNWGRVIRSTCGTNYGCGKAFGSGHRHVPHMLYWLEKNGVTHLADAAPVRGANLVAYIEKDGTATIRIPVENPGKVPMKCSADVDGKRLEWVAPKGYSFAPEIRLKNEKTRQIKVTMKVGNINSNGVINLRTIPESPKLGDKVAFFGRKEHFTDKALRAAGLKNVVYLEDANKADYNGFKAVFFGGDSLGISTNLLQSEGGAKLMAFLRAGGKVIFFQVNDEKWNSGLLGAPLLMQEPNSILKSIEKQHPIFKGVSGLNKTICYDTIVFAAAPWEVLAKDTEGNPCIVSLKEGKGEALVIMPSFDREFHTDNFKLVGIPVETCRAVMGNIVKWID